MSIIDKTNNGAHRHKKFDLSVSILNSEENWIQLPGFDISVAKTLSLILEKLKLPGRAENDQKIKYFLYKASSDTEDGYEILAENDIHGNPVVLNEYGIHNGIKLFVGALVLPYVKPGQDFNSSVKVTEEDEDDEIIEL